MNALRSANHIDAVVLTCEHAGKLVPTRYRCLFRSRAAQAALASHRGYDLGAHPLARAFAAALDAPLIAARVTRLLVDCNRSPHHRALLSEFSRPLSQAERDGVIIAYHTAHRSRIERLLRDRTTAGRCALHLAVHTFTPVLRGQLRRADIGILYDPSRPAEAALAAAWKHALHTLEPGLVVRFNYPYRGISDGLTTTLRGRLPRDRYLGIEIEVNQRHFTPGPLRAARHRLQQALIASLRAALGLRD